MKKFYVTFTSELEYEAIKGALAVRQISVTPIVNRSVQRAGFVSSVGNFSTISGRGIKLVSFQGYSDACHYSATKLNGIGQLIDFLSDDENLCDKKKFTVVRSMTVVSEIEVSAEHDEEALVLAGKSGGGRVIDQNFSYSIKI